MSRSLLLEATRNKQILDAEDLIVLDHATFQHPKLEHQLLLLLEEEPSKSNGQETIMQEDLFD